MGNQTSLKTALIYKCLDIVLVIAGQASIILSVQFEDLFVYFIVAGVALGATGLGLRAGKTGRSVPVWVLIAVFFPILVPVVGLAFMLIRGMRRENADPSRVRPVSMYAHASIALVLFLIAAVVMDSLGFALLSFFIALIWAATHKGAGYTRKVRLVVIGIYALMLVMAFGMKSVNYRTSHSNAETIIAACEKYKGKTGEYPAGLKDLVPAYLPKVPVARYTLMSGGFYYYRNRGPSTDSYRLIFVNEAPFGRKVYDSVSKGWHGID
jgi:hypothetical protein